MTTKKAKAKAKAKAKTPPHASRADGALAEDIRFLGRILGDTIREQAGADTFELVERIRRTAIHYRRDHDPASLKTLERTIRALSQPEAIDVVRAFSYFHLLANAAEDLHRSRSGGRRAAGGERGGGPRAAAASAGFDEPDRRLLRPGQGGAGADRPPHRGATQEHPRPSPRHLGPAGGARSDPVARVGGRGRARAAARGADPVEDERAPPGAADRGRRDRKRPRLLSFHLSPRPARPLRGARGRRW